MRSPLTSTPMEKKTKTGGKRRVDRHPHVRPTGSWDNSKCSEGRSVSQFEESKGNSDIENYYANRTNSELNNRLQYLGLDLMTRRTTASLLGNTQSPSRSWPSVSSRIQKSACSRGLSSFLPANLPALHCDTLQWPADSSEYLSTKGAHFRSLISPATPQQSSCGTYSSIIQ